MVLARHPFLSAMRVPAWSAWDRRTLLTAAGIAALSAAAMFVFFLLAEQAPPTSGISHESVTAPSTSKATSSSTDLKRVAPAITQADLKTSGANGSSQGQPLSFTLMRSRHSEKIGPLTLRLLKTDLRHGSCSLAVFDEKGRIRYHRLRTKESIRLPDGTTKTELTVTKIGKDRIEGVVASVQLTSVAFHSRGSRIILAARG